MAKQSILRNPLATLPRFLLQLFILMVLLSLTGDAPGEEPAAWRGLRSGGFQKAVLDPGAPTRLDQTGIHALALANSTIGITPEIDAATAESVARSRAMWEWNRKPSATAVFPVYGPDGMLAAHEVLLVFGPTRIGSLEDLQADWEGFLSEYRHQFAARRGEVETINEIMEGLNPPSASILVSATLDTPPILRSKLGLPPFFKTTPVAEKIAGKALGSTDPVLERLINLGGGHFGFEFRQGDQGVIVLRQPAWSWVESDKGWAFFAEAMHESEKELAERMGGEQALMQGRQILRTKYDTSLQKWLTQSMAPQSQTFIAGYLVHFDCFAPAEYDEEGWYNNDSIRAVLSTPLNYYDNRLNYGNLVSYHSNEVGILADVLCHTPDIQALWGDYFLDWSPVEFHDVMKYLANGRGYSFTDGLSLEGYAFNWRFDEGRSEIDADRPFIWSLDGTGVAIPKVVVGYDTGPEPEEWLIHSDTSTDVGLPFSRSHEGALTATAYFAGPMPGGEDDHAAELTFPDGNHEVYSCNTIETLTATKRSTIRWENWDNPSARVEIDYSADGGRIWTPIVNDREDVEWYRWDVPCGAVGDSTRVRIRQFDALDEQQSADGSFGNFRVLSPDCSDLVILTPTEEHSSCTGTSVLFSWVPLDCAGSYEVTLIDPSHTSNYYTTSGTELLFSGLEPRGLYTWYITVTDICGTRHRTPNRSFTVGDGSIAAPALTAPADGAPCRTYPDLLTWDPVIDASSYQVEIGFSCGGQVQVYDISETELPLLWLESGRTYFWRVRAKDDCENYGVFSDCRSFTTEGEALAAPTLVQPGNGALEQLVPGTLVWNDLTGATAYEVQLGTSCGSGATTLIDPAATSFVYSGLDGETTHHWRIRGRDACGVWGVWSGCYSFVTRSPATWFVKPDGTGDFPTIQEAIDYALDGDIIELDNGIFLGTGNRNVDLGAKALTIRSRSGHPDSCIINVQGHETNPGRGFLIGGGQGRDTILEGFTVENAYLASNGAGAGMAIGNSSPTIRHCNFEYNHAMDGGALFLSNSTALLYDCEFRLNGGRNSGGAIRASNCAGGDIVSCRFYGNSAVWGGGAIYNDDASAELWLCVFAGNSSDHWGGALHNDNAGSTPLIHRCTFDANHAPLGGGIYNRDNASPTIQNTIISNSLDGEAVYCTGGATVSVGCSDIFNNAGGDWVGCLAGEYSNPGNRSIDPWYCLPANYDYTLKFDSPLASENNSSCYQVGALGVGCGPHEPVTVLIEPDGTGDYPTIQDAIDDIPTGSTILLGNGTFTGDGNRDLMTYAKQLHFRSQNLNSDLCIIDCQGTIEDPHRAFYFSAATGGTRIERITILGGLADGDGGAIHCQFGASPVITGCVFEENLATGSGGAIAVEHDSSPEIVNCAFLNNSALGQGGGMVIKNGATMEVTSCWFRFNTAVAGGAVAATDFADLTMAWSVLDRNEATWGGGVLSYSGAFVTLYESTLARNSGSTGIIPSKAFGGLNNSGIGPSKIGDKTQTGGGGVYCGDSGNVSVQSSIIAFSLLGEAVLCEPGSTADVTCSDLFGNVGGDWLGCLDGLLGTSGNISADPLFCNTSPGDLYLGENSPCGPGSPEPGCDSMGALPVECGLVPVDEPGLLPVRFALYPAVPNPFNAGTKLAFDLVEPSKVSLVIFDLSGRRTAVLIDGENRGGGHHEERWNGRDSSGRPVAGGVYFYRLTTRDYTETKRMVLVK